MVVVSRGGMSHNQSRSWHEAQSRPKVSLSPNQSRTVNFLLRQAHLLLRIQVGGQVAVHDQPAALGALRQQ